MAACLGKVNDGHVFLLDLIFGYRVLRLLRLAVVTLCSFALLLLPFLAPSSLSQVFTRIFPFNRGLFEDKVANFWCASDIIFKWRNISFLGRNSLVRLSIFFTALGFLPSVWSLIYGGWANRIQTQTMKRTSEEEVQCPTMPLIPYALFTCSMSFFLFSFQVHEKSILLPLMPLTILLSSASPGSVTWDWGVLVNNVAVFRYTPSVYLLRHRLIELNTYSMLPLLQRDGLVLQTIAITVLWNWLIGSDIISLSRRGTFVSRLSLVSIFSLSLLSVV